MTSMLESTKITVARTPIVSRKIVNDMVSTIRLLRSAGFASGAVEWGRKNQNQARFPYSLVSCPNLAVEVQVLKPDDHQVHRPIQNISHFHTPP